MPQRSRTMLIGLAIVVPVIFVALVLTFLWPSVPDQILWHYTTTGTVEGYIAKTPWIAFGIVTAVAVIGTVLVRTVTLITQTSPWIEWVWAVPVAVVWFIVLSTLGMLLLQSLAGAWRLNAVLLVAASTGVSTLILSSRLLSPPFLYTPNAWGLSETVAGQEREWWAGRARLDWRVNLAVLTIFFSVFFTAYSLGKVTLWPIIALGSSILAVSLIFGDGRVQIGPRDVIVGLGPIAWPNFKVAMSTVVSARIAHVGFWQYGWFGLHRSGSKTVIKTRRGTAIELIHDDGTSIIVTCDRASDALRTVCEHHGVTRLSNSTTDDSDSSEAIAAHTDDIDSTL